MVTGNPEFYERFIPDKLVASGSSTPRLGSISWLGDPQAYRFRDGPSEDRPGMTLRDTLSRRRDYSAA
jgi:hypothetical protein